MVAPLQGIRLNRPRERTTFEVPARREGLRLGLGLSRGQARTWPESLARERLRDATRDRPFLRARDGPGITGSATERPLEPSGAGYHAGSPGSWGDAADL